jgi:fumarate hydratase class II
MTLGQEFSGYARQVEWDMDRIRVAGQGLMELALGGTAVGTGMNTHPHFATQVISRISEETGCDFREAKNHFAAQAGQDALVETSGALKTYSVSLTKIANDIRWLSSGPRCGLGELNLPALQPGSSIMPGKVNPVIPEVVLQVAGQVIGNDAAITFGAQAGNLELNVMLPMMAYNLLQSVYLLGTATRSFAEKCVKGISADVEKCASNLEQSLALVTALVPAIGYDAAAGLAKKAYEEKKTIREVALEEHVLPDLEVHRILDAAIGGKPKP